MSNPTSDQLQGYWFSICALASYFFLWLAYFTYQRRRILQERGEEINALIIKMWVEKQGRNAYYYVRYKFTFREYAYRDSERIVFSKWSQYKPGDDIEIIFDPQDPGQYNLPIINVGGECGMVYMYVFGFIVLMGVAIGFQIGICQMPWYHILISNTLIPFGGFIFILLCRWMVCCLCICYLKRKKGRTSTNSNDTENHETALNMEQPPTYTDDGTKLMDPEVQHRIPIIDWT